MEASRSQAPSWVRERGQAVGMDIPAVPHADGGGRSSAMEHDQGQAGSLKQAGLEGRAQSTAPRTVEGSLDRSGAHGVLQAHYASWCSPFHRSDARTTYRHPRYMTDLPLRDGPVESEFHVHWEEAPSSVTLWSVVGGAALTSTGVLEVLEGAYYWLAL